MINEKLVFMTNNKFYYRRNKINYYVTDVKLIIKKLQTLINADDSKVNEKVALYSLVFGSVSVAVNVFSIDNEH